MEKYIAVNLRAHDIKIPFILTMYTRNKWSNFATLDETEIDALFCIKIYCYSNVFCSYLVYVIKYLH